MKYKLSYYTIITDCIPDTTICIVYSTKASRAYNLERKIVGFLKEEAFDKIPRDIIKNLIGAEIIVPKNLDELHEYCEEAKSDSLNEDDNLISANNQLGSSFYDQVYSKEKMNDIVDLIQKRLTHLFKNKCFSEFRINLGNDAHLVCFLVAPNYELIDLTDIKKHQDKPYTKWYDDVQDENNGYWCTNCKILPICGGRAPKFWKDDIPPCPNIKFDIEDRLMRGTYTTQEDNSLEFGV